MSQVTHLANGTSHQRFGALLWYLALTCWALFLLSAWQVNAQFTYELLKSFGSPELPGSSPYAGLFEASDGALYGATSSGGADGLSGGTVFKIDLESNGYSVLRGFDNITTDGRSPIGGVIEASDGLLYGAAQSGGSSNLGTVFKLHRDGSGFVVLRNLGTSTNDAAVPWGRLVEGSDGSLYGTTAGGGGRLSVGTVFRLNKDGSGYAVLHGFRSSTNRYDGYYPRCGLLEGSDGALYGTTEWGGSDDDGTVFKLSKNGSNYMVLHNFGSIPEDGEYPTAALTEGSDGILYGVAPRGGTANGGAVFKLNKDGSDYRVLRSFGTTPTDGRSLRGALIEGSDGALYGTTMSGGSTNEGGVGTVFRLSRNGSNYAVLYRFGTVPGDGRAPLSSLVESRDGSFYGVTAGGGSSVGGGIFFRLRFVLRSALRMTPDGPRLDFGGAPGRSYDVQRALMVRGPWDTIATRSAPPDGFIEYTDVAPPEPVALYRVRLRSAPYTADRIEPDATQLLDP
jgi:uncharacterized repeat protein (TIGR03803 family)